MMKKFIANAKNQMSAMLTSRKAASLWEYLLVIAIVCIIGAALISVITGTDGINSLWTTLFNRFKNLISTT